MSSTLVLKYRVAPGRERMIEQSPEMLSKLILELQLGPEDVTLLDQCRGDLSREVFMIALLRLVSSGRVSGTPVWMKESIADRAL
jgi:hypothetical protein